MVAELRSPTKRYHVRYPRKSTYPCSATIRAPALLAQLVEHLHGKEGVSGSSPEEGSAKTLQTGTFCWAWICSLRSMLGYGTYSGTLRIRATEEAARFWLFWANPIASAMTVSSGMTPEGPGF